MTHGPSSHEADCDSQTVISTTGLSRMYETASESVWAVRDVSFSVDRGQFVCLYGTSGSGKSTLLNLLAGLDVPSAGSATVCGHDLNAMDEDERADLRLRNVGVVFQDHHLIDEFTALENVMLPLEAQGMRASEARKSALAQLKAVGLRGLGDRTPLELSGGQRQRVGIARALVGGRQVLLADEPTGALDSANSTKLFELLRQLCDEGATVVLATHEEESRRFADATFRMKDGSLSAVDARSAML